MGARVLTIDDSRFLQGILSRIVSQIPGLEHVGSAFNGRQGLEMTLALRPDIITLDVEMPVMDGLETLRRIMAVRPTPVIMLSSYTRRAASITVRALEAGALDFITKPEGDAGGNIELLRSELAEKTLALLHPQGALTPGGLAATLEARKHAGPRVWRPCRIVVIGSSTGGTAALTRIFSRLPRRMGATLIAVQHMPFFHTAAFARRLSDVSAAPVSLAEDKGLLEPGRAYVAPGGSHLSVHGSSFSIAKGEAVNGHMPSIDVTMTSLARRFGPDVCAILLTGMGKDGARGIADVRDAGGVTVAQDEASSVIFGMPKAAILTGKVDMVLSDAEIAEEITGALGK